MKNEVQHIDFGHLYNDYKDEEIQLLRADAVNEKIAFNALLNTFCVDDGSDENRLEIYFRSNLSDQINGDGYFYIINYSAFYS